MEYEMAVASLSALASIFSISVSLRDLVKKYNVSAQDALSKHSKDLKINEDEKELLRNKSAQESIIELSKTQTISDALLEQLTSDLKRCEDKHIEGLKAAEDNELERRKVIDKAAKCMCNVLIEIKLHNEDNLPTKQFEDYWKAYRC